MGFLVVVELLLVEWVKPGKTFRFITNSYVLFGALLVYPIITHPDTVTFIKTEYGMSYITADYTKRVYYNAYLFGYVIILLVELTLWFLKKKHKRETIAAWIYLLLIVGVGLSLVRDTFVTVDNKAVFPISAITQTLAFLVAYAVARKTNISNTRDDVRY